MEGVQKERRKQMRGEKGERKFEREKSIKRQKESMIVKKKEKEPQYWQR